MARHQGHSHLHSAQVRGHGGEVGDRLERVVIQEDQVTSVAGGNGALAIGARSQGSGLVRERAGFQGLPLGRGAVHRGGHGQPSVQRGHRSVGSHNKPHAGLDHRSQWEAAVRPVRPAPLVTSRSSSRVGGLHTGPHAGARSVGTRGAVSAR